MIRFSCRLRLQNIYTIDSVANITFNFRVHHFLVYDFSCELAYQKLSLNSKQYHHAVRE